MSDRDPSADRSTDEVDGDEGLISRFWKAPPVPPRPVESPPGNDRDAEDR